MWAVLYCTVLYYQAGPPLNLNTQETPAAALSKSTHHFRSLCGKNLTTILNEYAAAKAKETSHEVPVMMTSLWKKLDFTLNQIKSLQNSPAIAASQRVRSRMALANMTRQRSLTMSPASSVLCSPLPTRGPISSNMTSTPSLPSLPSPAAPLGSLSGTHLQIQDGCRILNVSNSPIPAPVPVPVPVPDLRLAPNPIFPGRRKWDFPKKRGGGGGSGPTGRSTMSGSSLAVEQQPDEVVNENFPGEIHMSDDAIHDILEQTESDPAFQALFDLFDYSNAQGGVSSVSDATAILVEKTAKEPRTRKTRKSVVPTSTKKTVPVHRGRTSRLEKTTARLLQPEPSPIAAVNSTRAEKKAPLPVAEMVALMDVDERFIVPAPPSDNTSSQNASEPARKDDRAPIPSLPHAPTIMHSTNGSIGSVAVETMSSSNVNPIQKYKALSASEKTNSHDVNKAQAPSISSTVPCTRLSLAPPLAQESNKSLLPSITLPPPIAPIITPIASASPTSTPSTPGSTSAVPALPSNNPVDSHKCEADPNNIVSLKIIISDEQAETPPTTNKALSQAISSISGDKIPTIFLSSPANSPSKFPGGPPGTPQANQEEIALAVSSLQGSDVLQPAVSEATPVGGQLVAPSQAAPSYIIQLPVDAANPALPGASYFIVTDPVAAQDPQARPLLLPAGISQGQPLPASQYAVATPPRVQGYPSGSTFILQSPAGPMMVPFSMMGQNNVGKLPLVSNQFVAIPSLVPKQQQQQPEPAKPKAPAHTAALKQPTVSKTGEQNVAQRQPTEKPGLQNPPDGTSPSHRRILQFDSAGLPLAPEPPPPPPHTASTIKPTAASPTSSSSTSCLAKQPGKVNPKPAPRPKPAILGGDKARRRIAPIRSTTDAQPEFTVSEETEKRLSSETQSLQQQRENVRKTPRKQDHKVQVENIACDQTDAVDGSEPDPTNKTESERLKSKERKRSGTRGNQARPNDSTDDQSSKSSSSNSSAKSSSKKDVNAGPRKDPADKSPGKSREGQPEKEPSKERANKENENKKASGEGVKQQPEVERRLGPPVILPAPTLQPKTSSKTSTLTKQAAEMLHDIQGLNPPTTPVKKTGSGSADAPLTPGAGRSRDESTEGLRTPARQRLLRDVEGTPRRLIAPKTPDLPTCSPASEAGSESSINMAAHTLMILSRAAISRTGSPLKDSLRQEEAGEKSPSTAKQAKKRKRTETPASVPDKESRRSSGSKKKEKKQKKTVDCFPDDLDVDKFLSLLHYDE
ncbi:hypothetical protein CRUP_034764 [Coryphaenoides rupestris]|nr:hypothetical protein CRUP_034764 [Coryphaenoides rupestris]